jgi:predicted DNA-binding transcriptional regulator AlpA
MEHELLTAKEVMTLMRCTRSTLDKWVDESKKGRRRFPLPIASPARSKRLWRRADVDRYIDTGHTAAPPYDQAAEQLKRMAVKKSR